VGTFCDDQVVLLKLIWNQRLEICDDRGLMNLPADKPGFYTIMSGIILHDKTIVLQSKTILRSTRDSENNEQENEGEKKADGQEYWPRVIEYTASIL